MKATYQVEIHAQGWVHSRKDDPEHLAAELAAMLLNGQLPVFVRVNGGHGEDGEKLPPTPRTGPGEGWEAVTLDPIADYADIR